MASSATVPRPPARLPELATLSSLPVTRSVTVAIELECDCSNHGHSLASGPESIMFQATVQVIPGQNTGNPAGLTGRLRHRGLNVESRALARPLNSDSSRLHPSHHENHSPPPHLRRRPVAICGRRVCMPHSRRVTVCMPHGRRASVCMPRRVPHPLSLCLCLLCVCARPGR